LKYNIKVDLNINRTHGRGLISFVLLQETVNRGMEFRCI